MPEITIPAKDGGSFKAYIAMPEKPAALKKFPCVIVIQEIFGINQGLREKCDWLAAQGFIACAPDLFWRIEPNIELSDQVPAELERAFALFGEFDINQGLEDIKATMHTLKGHADSSGKVGCLGYCLGGQLAYLTACHSDINASIGYYGVGIEGLLADANNISAPLILHMAQNDEFVPPEAQQQIQDGLKDNNHITIHDYENVSHAFTRVGGDNYDAEAAKIADERSIKFLIANLK